MSHVIDEGRDIMVWSIIVLHLGLYAVCLTLIA